MIYNTKPFVEGSLRYNRILGFAGGVLLFLVFQLFWFLHDPVMLEMLQYAGWIVLVVGIVLVYVSLYYLGMKGKLEKRNEYNYTEVLVDSGIYAVVRHPQSLGWIFVCLAVILFGQHWLSTVFGTVGMARAYLISKQEDQYNIEKFGSAYESYMQSVPAMNLLTGVVRLIRRRKREIKRQLTQY